MTQTMVAVCVVVGLIALLGLWVVLTYDALLAASRRADEAWAEVDTQLRRRHALARLVPDHAVQYACDAIDAAGDPIDRAVAERRLSSALSALDRAADGLSEIELDLQSARRTYNADVRLFLTRKRRFPAALVATLGDFPDRVYFELDRTGESEPLARAA